MKRLKFFLTGLLAVAVLGATFAFTSHTAQKKARTLPKVFRFSSTALITTTTVVDPNNWTDQGSTASSDNTDVVIHEIQINSGATESTYVDGNDQLIIPTNSTFATDIKNAAGLIGDNTVKHFTSSNGDYTLLTNSTR